MNVKDSWNNSVLVFDMLSKITGTDVDDGVVLFARAIGKDQQSMDWLQKKADQWSGGTPNPVPPGAMDFEDIPDSMQRIAEESMKTQAIPKSVEGRATDALATFLHWLPKVLLVVDIIRSAMGAAAETRLASTEGENRNFA